MNIEPARRHIFRLQTGAFAVLLGMLIAWAYWLQRTQLLYQMDEELRTIGRHVTFSVEHENGKPEFDESIYLANRRERVELGPHAAAQWLDLQGRVVVSRGSLPIGPRPLSDDLLEYQDRPVPARVYTLQATAGGKPVGYARVALSLSPVQDQLNRFLASLLGIGGVLLLGSGILSWWWTGRVLRPIQAAHQELSTFAGALAHELRSPLTALRINSESISQRWRELPPEELDLALQELSQTTVDMGRLVDDLLLLAQLRRKGEPPAAGLIDVSRVLQETVESLQKLAATRQISLRFQVVETPQLCVDEGQLRIMLRNLIENALQYTDAGGSVEVRLDNQQLAVSDSGIGMSAQEVSRMCEPFWRAEPSRARHLGGAGLGLAIVLALANRHGMELRVESRPGQGSCLWLQFPGP